MPDELEAPETELSFDQRPGVDPKEYAKNQVYKKWFFAGSVGGFLSIRVWPDAGMFHIDIGQLNAKKELVGHTEVWVPAIKFASYTRAVASGTYNLAYPNATFAHYGGAMIEQKPMSRIFKVEYWTKDEPQSGLHFKNGHFNAKRTDQGAYQPLLKEEIRRNSIKVTYAELLEIAYRLDLSISSCIINSPGWLADVTN